MKIPQGLTASGAPIPLHLVLLVVLALYGLKQSAHEFNKVLSGYLRSKGYRPISAERSIYANGRVFIAIYVDGLLIAGPHLADIEAKDILKDRLMAKDLGEAKRVLGIQIPRDKTARTLTVDQSEYIREPLAKYLEPDAPAAKTPMLVGAETTLAEPGVAVNRQQR